jgi:hypothetical protein
VKFEKNLAFDPLTASFRPFSGLSEAFPRFFGFEPKNMKIEDIFTEIQKKKYFSSSDPLTASFWASEFDKFKKSKNGLSKID